MIYYQKKRDTWYGARKPGTFPGKGAVSHEFLYAEQF